MITTTQFNAEVSDDQAAMVGVFWNQNVSSPGGNSLPESARDEVTKQYARLMARTSVAQIRALRKDNTVQEKNDESNDG